VVGEDKITTRTAIVAVVKIITGSAAAVGAPRPLSLVMCLGRCISNCNGRQIRAALCEWEVAGWIHLWGGRGSQQRSKKLKQLAAGSEEE
jgi:hypothetical protein